MFGGTPAHTLFGWPFPWLGFPDLLTLLAAPIMFALTTLYWSVFARMIFVLVVAILPPIRSEQLQTLILFLVASPIIGLSLLLPELLGPVCWKRLFLTPCPRQ